MRFPRGVHVKSRDNNKVNIMKGAWHLSPPFFLPLGDEILSSPSGIQVPPPNSEKRVGQRENGKSLIENGCHRE